MQDSHGLFSFVKGISIMVASWIMACVMVGFGCIASILVVKRH